MCPHLFPPQVKKEMVSLLIPNFFYKSWKCFNCHNCPIIRWVLNTLSHKVRHWRPELPSVYFLELDDLSGFGRVSQMLKKLIVNSLLTGNWFSNLEPAARCDANRVSSSRYSKLSERSCHHNWCCTKFKQMYFTYNSGNVSELMILMSTWQWDDTSIACELAKVGEGQEEKDQWEHSFLKNAWECLES